jgi:AraC-like DNA-binding protein/mannose-6-phosphate isomerase-like protein (cupin superfamily)
MRNRLTASPAQDGPIITIHSQHPPGQARPHQHDLHELICVISGVYRVELAGENHRLIPGQSILYLAKTLHHARSEPDLRIYALQFTSDERWLPEDWLRRLPCRGHDPSGHIQTCLSWLVDWAHTAETSPADQMALIRTALCWHGGGPGFHGDDLDRARWHLERNLELPMTLPSPAVSVGMGRSTLARRFLKRFGETPMAHRRRFRLDQAIRLIEAGELSLQAVAQAVGFATGSHLSNTLFQNRKIRPASIRKQ